MQNDNNPKSPDTPKPVSQPPVSSSRNIFGKRKVIQPLPDAIDEIVTPPPVQDTFQPTTNTASMDNNQSIEPEPNGPNAPALNTHKLYPLPSKTTVPTNMSENSVGNKEEGKLHTNWIRLLIRLILPILVVGVAGGAWLYLKGTTGYGLQTVNVNNFSYMINFANQHTTASSPVTQGVPALTGKDLDGSTVTAWVEQTSSIPPCSGQSYALTISGSNAQVCNNTAQTVYTADFTVNGHIYEANLIEVLPVASPISSNDAQAIIGSVKIL